MPNQPSSASPRQPPTPAPSSAHTPTPPPTHRYTLRPRPVQPTNGAINTSSTTSPPQLQFAGVHIPVQGPAPGPIQGQGQGHDEGQQASSSPPILTPTLATITPSNPAATTAQAPLLPGALNALFPNFMDRVAVVNTLRQVQNAGIRETLQDGLVWLARSRAVRRRREIREEQAARNQNQNENHGQARGRTRTRMQPQKRYLSASSLDFDPQVIRFQLRERERTRMREAQERERQRSRERELARIRAAAQDPAQPAARIRTRVRARRPIGREDTWRRALGIPIPGISEQLLDMLLPPEERAAARPRPRLRLDDGHAAVENRVALNIPNFNPPPRRAQSTGAQERRVAAEVMRYARRNVARLRDLVADAAGNPAGGSAPANDVQPRRNNYVPPFVNVPLEVERDGDLDEHPGPQRQQMWNELHGSSDSQPPAHDTEFYPRLRGGSGDGVGLASCYVGDDGEDFEEEFSECDDKDCCGYYDEDDDDDDGEFDINDEDTLIDPKSEDKKYCQCKCECPRCEQIDDMLQPSTLAGPFKEPPTVNLRILTQTPDHGHAGIAPVTYNHAIVSGQILVSGVLMQENQVLYPVTLCYPPYTTPADNSVAQEIHRVEHRGLPNGVNGVNGGNGDSEDNEYSSPSNPPDVPPLPPRIPPNHPFMFFLRGTPGLGLNNMNFTLPIRPMRDRIFAPLYPEFDVQHPPPSRSNINHDFVVVRHRDDGFGGRFSVIVQAFNEPPRGPTLYGSEFGPPSAAELGAGEILAGPTYAVYRNTNPLPSDLDFIVVQHWALNGRSHMRTVHGFVLDNLPPIGRDPADDDLEIYQHLNTRHGRAALPAQNAGPRFPDGFPNGNMNGDVNANVNANANVNGNGHGSYRSYTPGTIENLSSTDSASDIDLYSEELPPAPTPVLAAPAPSPASTPPASVVNVGAVNTMLVLSNGMGNGGLPNGHGHVNANTINNTSTIPTSNPAPGPSHISGPANRSPTLNQNGYTHRPYMRSPPRGWEFWLRGPLNSHPVQDSDWNRTRNQNRDRDRDWDWDRDRDEGADADAGADRDRDRDRDRSWSRSPDGAGE